MSRRVGRCEGRRIGQDGTRLDCLQRLQCADSDGIDGIGCTQLPQLFGQLRWVLGEAVSISKSAGGASGFLFCGTVTLLLLGAVCAANRRTLGGWFRKAEARQA